MMIPKVVLITVKGLLVTWPAAVCAAGLFIYFSTPSVMRLRTEPPADFCESGPDLSQESREAEERLASAYWASAANLVQWRYRYGESLPSNPPPEFAIDPQTARESNLQDTPANRLRYWLKFRQIWLTPKAWRRSHQWDTSWVRGALVWVRDAAGELVVHAFGFDRR
jgi:hypothetical protein